MSGENTVEGSEVAEAPASVKRISATQFISMRREVAKQGGTIDDVAKAWRKLTGNDQTDEQLRQYMHTRTGQARKALVAQEFTDEQINLLLPELKPRKITRSPSSSFVDSMKEMLADLEAEDTDEGVVAEGADSSEDSEG
jgi:lipopolysaccharide biosynthesis regulator YciM